jgi:hypothetical protein
MKLWRNPFHHIIGSIEQGGRRLLCRLAEICDCDDGRDGVGQAVTAEWLARRWRGRSGALFLAGVAGLMWRASTLHWWPPAWGDRAASTSTIATQAQPLPPDAAHVVHDLDRRLGQIDTAIETAKTGTTLWGNRE